jgi:hypothetical protein
MRQQGEGGKQMLSVFREEVLTLISPRPINNLIDIIN